MRAISLLPAHPDAVPAGYVLLEAAERCVAGFARTRTRTEGLLSTSTAWWPTRSPFRALWCVCVLCCSKGVVPSVHAFTSLVNVCAKSNNIPEAFHGVAPLHARTHARTRPMSDLNAMARTAVERMWKLKVVPDVNIFTSLIQLCTRCKDVNRAFEVLELMRLFDVRPDAFVYTSLINAGAKAPLPPPPCAVVRVRWCVCGGACACAVVRVLTANVLQAGEPERALAVMEMMKTDGVKPSAITYNALISALASKGARLAVQPSLNRMRAGPIDFVCVCGGGRVRQRTGTWRPSYGWWTR